MADASRSNFWFVPVNKFLPQFIEYIRWSSWISKVLAVGGRSSRFELESLVWRRVRESCSITANWTERESRLTNWLARLLTDERALKRLQRALVASPPQNSNVDSDFKPGRRAEPPASKPFLQGESYRLPYVTWNQEKGLGFDDFIFRVFQIFNLVVLYPWGV